MEFYRVCSNKATRYGNIEVVWFEYHLWIFRLQFRTQSHASLHEQFALTFIDPFQANQESSSNTGRIQCEVMTTLPILSSWIKKFLGQQSKIWVDNSVEKLFR